MKRLLPNEDRFRRSLLFAATTIFWVACQSPGDPGSMDNPNPPDPDKPDMALPITKDSIDIKLAQVMVPAGTERTVCITDRFPLTAAMDVMQIATAQEHSHHVIFYKYVQGNAPTVNTTPQDCSPLDIVGGGTLKAPLFIGESSDPAQNVLKLPTNVVYHIEPTDYYTLELHVVNASPGDLAASADVYLTPTEANAQTQRADMLFFNNTKGLGKSYDGKNPGLPPMAMTTIDPSFGAIGSNVKVFGVTTHQHHLGAGIAVSKSTSATAPGTALFTNLDWQHPNLFRLPDDQPLTFKSGEGLRWVCSYNNTTTSYVRFGESGITDEMCIIWGYYYPSAGLKIIWN